jgi:hypothetical protein
LAIFGVKWWMKSCASSEVGRFGQADLVFIIGKSIDEGNRLTEIIDAFRLWANQPVGLGLTVTYPEVIPPHNFGAKFSRNELTHI